MDSVTNNQTAERFERMDVELARQKVEIDRLKKEFAGFRNANRATGEKKGIGRHTQNDLFEPNADPIRGCGCNRRWKYPCKTKKTHQNNPEMKLPIVLALYRSRHSKRNTYAIVTLLQTLHLRIQLETFLPASRRLVDSLERVDSNTEARRKKTRVESVNIRKEF